MIIKAQRVTTDNYGNKLVTDEASQLVYIVAPADKKTGKPFPNWEEIAPGRDVEGNPWQSKTNGKWYLFAPEPEKTYNKAKWQPKGAEVAKAQEVKGQMIAQAQDNKNGSIKISSTARDATLLTIAEIQNNPEHATTFEDTWLKWREWLLDNYEVEEMSRPPFSK